MKDSGHTTQATWGGRFSEGPAHLMLRFSESVSFDAVLAPYDILCSQAHARMLGHVGLLSEEEVQALVSGLETLGARIKAGDFAWKEALEDVHMNIEQALLELTPVAAKLHTARSRNDQVATDMRLYLKDACRELQEALLALIDMLLTVAERESATIIPGYTHLQRAQPVTVGHHLLAYVEMFGRDARRFAQAADSANWCPLGSGAIAGSTLPIDRLFTARALGFVDSNGQPRVTRNSMDAVADRDYMIEFVSACAICGTHLSRVAEDVILWSSEEFGFVRLPDAFTTGSSLMPQKKNPDSLEILRGKSARLQGHLQTLLTLVKGLPLTYNRDLQEDKPPVFDAHRQTLLSLDVLRETLRGAVFRIDRCMAAASDPRLLATDLADYLVALGTPFREAHHCVGRLVALAESRREALHQLDESAARQAVPQLGDDWRSVFDLSRAFAMRERPGMPGPNQIAAAIAHWRTFPALMVDA